MGKQSSNRRNFLKRSAAITAATATGLAGFPAVVRGQSGSPAGKGAETRLMYVDNAFPTTYTAPWVHYYLDGITAKTKGKLKFDILWGAGLGNPHSAFLQVTKQGLQPFSSIMIGSADGTPEFLTGMLPMLFDNYRQFDKYRRQQEPALAKFLLEKWNTIMLANIPLYDQALSTKKPIKTLNDLKGMKVRVLTQPESDWIKALGGIPVTVPYIEVYSALQRGVVDGVITYADALRELKYQEVVKYVPIPTVRFNWWVWVMNKGTYDAMPADWKKAINDMKSPTEEYALSEMDKGFAWSQNVLTKAGVDFTPLPKSEMDKARALAVPIWEAWANKNGPLAQENLKVARKVTGH